MAAAPVVVDACSSLNLFATGRRVDIARAANLQLLVLPEVQAEAKHLFGEPDEQGVRPEEPIDWGSLLSSDVARLQSFPDEAVTDLIGFATQLTDVDAQCVALAKHLKLGLISDDGKVRKVFSSAGGLGLRSTVSMIRQAAVVLKMDSVAVRVLFDQIRKKARFEPSRKDPDFAWYLQLMSGAE